MEVSRKETRMTCDIALTRARPSKCSFDFKFVTPTPTTFVAAT